MEFQSWFDNSKVVDADGNPLVVYHGTRRSFIQFDKNAPTATPWLLGNDNKNGFFFSTDPGWKSDIGPWGGAAEFAGTRQVDGETRAAIGANIRPVYLSIKAPYRMTADEYRRTAARPDFKEETVALGYDGVQIDNGTRRSLNPLPSSFTETRSSDTSISIFLA